MKNYIRAFIDEGNAVITTAQLHIITSHGEVSGARVSLIQALRQANSKVARNTFYACVLHFIL